MPEDAKRQPGYLKDGSFYVSANVELLFTTSDESVLAGEFAACSAIAKLLVDALPKNVLDPIDREKAVSAIEDYLFEYAVIVVEQESAYTEEEALKEIEAEEDGEEDVFRKGTAEGWSLPETITDHDLLDQQAREDAFNRSVENAKKSENILPVETVKELPLF